MDQTLLLDDSVHLYLLTEILPTTKLNVVTLEFGDEPIFECQIVGIGGVSLRGGGQLFRSCCPVRLLIQVIDYIEYSSNALAVCKTRPKC